MPRTALPLRIASDAGTAAAGVAPDAAGGIVPPNSVVIVHNGSGGSINVTTIAPVGAPAVPAGLDPADRVLAVPAGQFAAIGPFDPSYYAQVSGANVGQVWIDFSAVASVTAFAVQVTR